MVQINNVEKFQEWTFVQVECSPLCDILWLKDGVPIQDNSDYFTVRSRQVFTNVSIIVMMTIASSDDAGSSMAKSPF